MSTTITGLPNATTPLSGTERVPMDQAGATKDATTQDIANLAPGTDLAYSASTRQLSSSTGADVTLPLAGADAGLMSAADKSKLDSVTVDRAVLTVAPVRNNSGVTIPKGAAVYVTGSSGTTVTVALADASTEATAANTLGVAFEAIADNATGLVVTEGELTGLNTAALTEGGLLWLSETTGGLTTTRPTQPAHGVVIGWCIKQGSGTSGIIYVRVDNGQELNELHDVLIASPSTGQILRRASDGLWKNHTLTATDIGAATAAQGAKADTAIQPGSLATVATSGAYADLSGRPTLGTAAALNTGISAGNVVALDGSGRLPAVDGSQLTGLAAGGISSIGLSAPTGFSVTGSPLTANGTLTLSYATGYSLPTTAKQGDWDTAYSERLRWDGGATGLNAATARTSLGLGTAATANTGTSAGNVPVLDGSGLLPSALLPGFVDDVLEFANVAAFPATGETGKLYVSLATNRVYRWSGSIYVEINPSPGSTDAVPEGSVNLYFTTSRAAAAAPVQSVAGRTGSVTLSSGDISGLGTFATANAATPPAIGGTTPAAGAFTNLSASAELTIPSGAPGTPTAGDLYRNADTLRYRDSSNTERLLLNATDNLANLASAATARTNLGAAASGAVTSSGLTQATARILGRSSSGTGAVEEISLPTGFDLLAGALRAPAEIGLACSDETTALTVGTGKLTVRMPYAMTLTAVRLSVTTAPTGSALVVNIKEGGVSIFSTKPQIDAGATTSVGSGTPAVISDAALADNAVITIDIDQIGSTVAGAGLKVWLIGRRA